MDRLTLEILLLKCSLKFNLSSKIIPRCFCEDTWSTGTLLNIKFGCKGLLILWLKITSFACFEGSGLKLIFHWFAQALTFAKSWFNSSEDKVISFTIEKSDVSSANNFTSHSKSDEIHVCFFFIRNLARALVPKVS